MVARGKPLALSVALVAVVVLGAVTWALRDRAREWWFLRALVNHGGEEQRAAARVLVEMNSARAAPVLGRLLREAHRGAETRSGVHFQVFRPASSRTLAPRPSWHWIGESLLGLGEPGIEELLRLLAAGDGLATVPFLTQLGGMYLQRVAVLLLDERPEVFRPAASILSASEGLPVESVPLLVEALEEGKEIVAGAAAKSLGRLGVAAESALPALERREDRSPDLKSVVRDAIEKITGDFD